VRVAAFAIAVGLAAFAEAFPAGAAPCEWAGREVLHEHGQVQQGGLAGEFRRRIEPLTGRFAETTDFGIVASGRGYDGRFAWLQDVSGASHELNSDFAVRLARSEAWLAGHLSCPAPEGRTGAAAVGQKVESGRTFAVWRVTPPRGASIELWFDEATARLDRAILQYPENRLIRHFADWRDVGDGQLMPFLERDEDPEDQEEKVVRLDAATPRNTGGSFRAPPRPRDARLLGGRRLTVAPYEDDHRTRIFLPVFLNGKGPYPFELDNGGHFILSAETARDVGLAPQGAFASTGAGNDVSRAGYVRIRSLRVGGAELSDQPAKVLPLSASANDRGPRLPRAGILGLEFFERFVVAIDHRHKTVTLRLAGAVHPVKGQAAPIVFDEDAALVRGGYEGAVGNVMLDIGNAGATIIEDYWARTHGLASALAKGLVLGDGRISRGRIAVGPFSLEGETAAYYGPADRGSEYTRSVAAVLGEPLLSRFNATYDYARKTVWLEYLPDVSVLPFNRAGLQLSKASDGTFKVVAVSSGSPAAEAGLAKGDIVLSIAGLPARSLSRADAMDILQGPVGTSVPITLGPVPPRTVTFRLRDLLP